MPMSKSLSSSSKLQSRKSQKSRKISVLTRLVQLAQKVTANPQVEGLSPIEQELIDLVERLIVQGSDHTLRQAMDQLQALNHPDAAHLIEFWAHDAASFTTLGWKTSETSGPVPGTASIMVIPLIVESSQTLSIPLSIPNRETMFELVRSFRRHGLIGPGPMAVVFPGLYRLEDLPRSWSAQRHWLDQCLAAVTNQGDEIPPPTPEPEPLTVFATQHRVFLRFLVGIALFADDDRERGPLGDNTFWDDDTSEIFAKPLEAWQQDAAAILSAVIPQATFNITRPSSWEDGLDAGRAMQNTLRLQHSLVNFIITQDVDPDGVIVALTWEAATRSWIITIEMVNTAIEAITVESEPISWACKLSPHEEIALILDTLQTYGIVHTIIEERE